FNLGLVAEVAPTLAAGLEITRVQTQEVIRDWIIRMYTGEEPVSHGLAEQVLTLDTKNEERSRLEGVRAPHLGEIVRESHFTIARVNGHGISSDAGPPAGDTYVRKAVVDVSVRKWLDDREAGGIGNVVAAE